MNNTKNIIGTGFVFALLLMGAVVVVGLKYMGSIHRDMENIVKVHNIKTNLVFILSTIGRDRSLVLNHMMLSKDTFEMDDDLQTFSNLASQFIETRDKLRAMGLSAIEKAALEKVLFEVRLSQDVQSNVSNVMLGEEIMQSQTCSC